MSERTRLDPTRTWAKVEERLGRETGPRERQLPETLSPDHRVGA